MASRTQRSKNMSRRFAIFNSAFVVAFLKRYMTIIVYNQYLYSSGSEVFFEFGSLSLGRGLIPLVIITRNHC